MEIAAYINIQEEVCEFCPEGFFRLYEQVSGTWVAKRDIALTVPEKMGLTDLILAVSRATAQFGECRVALLGGLRGMLRALLEEHGLRTWKSSGSLFEQLDNVVNREQELATPMAQSVDAAPVAVGEAGAAHFSIDLVEILQHPRHPASRDVLLPFLRSAKFRVLEIKCDHLPRWFEPEVAALGMQAEIRPPAGADDCIHITVRPGAGGSGTCLPTSLVDCSSGSCGKGPYKHACSSSYPGVFDA
jgi:Fe-only nitrogenase accessory protein AnfO